MSVWWCVDIVGKIAYVDRQLKHWVDEQPVLWEETTRQVTPDIHHAYQFGQLYYVCADKKREALRKVNLFRSR